jgi:Family of unknown function (DUF5372)
VQYRHTWGEHRVYYHAHDGQLCSMPASWTSLGALDPFVALAAGRSLFRVADLLALAQLCAHVAGAAAGQEER